MTFTSLETSRTQGEPVTLLLFRYGQPENAYFAYTDAEQPIINGGITYLPVPVDRDSMKATGTLDKTSSMVRMPMNTDLARMLLQYPPSETINLTIYQGHLGDADEDFLVAQTGRVLSGKREGDEFVVTFEPISTSLRRPMIRRHYQLSCPHVLYGTQCRANKAAATILRSATGADGATLFLDGAWEDSGRKPFYLGGVVSWALADGRIEVREIIAVTETSLLLGYPGPELTSGTSVSITLGCNHQMSDCATLHNNILNFGGQPWIPTKNPIGIINNFY